MSSVFQRIFLYAMSLSIIYEWKRSFQVLIIYGNAWNVWPGTEVNGGGAGGIEVLYGSYLSWAIIHILFQEDGHWGDEASMSK